MPKQLQKVKDWVVSKVQFEILEAETFDLIKNWNDNPTAMTIIRRVKRLKDNKEFKLNEIISEHPILTSEGEVRCIFKISYFHDDKINVNVNCRILSAEAFVIKRPINNIDYIVLTSKENKMKEAVIDLLKKENPKQQS